MLAIDEAVAKLEATWGEEASEYLDYHRLRYRHLLGTTRQAVERAGIPGGELRILDVGPSYQTGLLRSLWPEAAMDTLGFYDTRFGAVGRDRHIEFDLNNTVLEANWVKAGPYNLIVMAEVIEHLYTAPYIVLRFFRSLMSPEALLILQTPNAVRLEKRLATLKGRNPFEPIRETPGNPGHFCEYVMADLRSIAERAGLEVENEELVNYFGRNGWRKAIYDAACRLLPGELADGITMVLRRGPE